MGLLARLEQPRATASADQLERILRQYYGATTKSGVAVTAETAMRCAAVFACVRVVSEDVAKLPIILYRRTKDGKQRAVEHAAHKLLNEKPNSWQTPYEFKEMLQQHLEYRGNAFAYKVRVRGQVRELIPLHPDRVTVHQAGDWALQYEVRGLSGVPSELTPNEIMHLRGMSIDGFTGLPTITLHRETIGNALAALEHGARQFANGVRMSAILSHPKQLKADAAKRISDSVQDAYSGDNQWRPIVLEEGMTITPVGMSNEDAQYLESRKFSRSEIAGIWRIPPHKIADLERSTFSNIEHQSREYVVDSLLPRLVRWEERLALELLTPAERANYFFEYLTEGLLRGDTKTRYEAYASAITNGWMNRNEARVRENMNPEEGLDEFLTQLNMAKPGDKTVVEDKVPA